MINTVSVLKALSLNYYDCSEVRNGLKFRFSSEFLTKNPDKSPKLREGPLALRNAWQESVFWIERVGPAPVSKEQAATVYDRHVHSRFENTFGPYFRLLYTLLNKIKSDPILSQKEKEDYGNLVRSQLGSYELAVVGLNGLSAISKDLSDLITEFHLLKYIPSGKRKETLQPHYAEKTFEG
jgi:hypothetical protein